MERRTPLLLFFFFQSLVGQVFADIGSLILPSSTRSVELSPIRLERKVSWTPPVVCLPGPVDIELLLGPEQEFRGLGEIMIRGVSVSRGISGTLPEFAGPDFPVTTGFRLEGVTIHEQESRVDLILKSRTSDGASGRLVWTIRAQQDRGFLEPAVGFSYCFHFECPDGKTIRKIIDRSSWSFGGSVEGCLFVEQSNPYGLGGPKCFVIGEETEIPPRKKMAFRISPESRFGTGPFLDFLSVSNASLIRFIREPVLTFNETRRDPEEPELHITETWITSLSTSFDTAETFIFLVPEGGVQAWLNARRRVVEKQQTAAGLVPATPLPMTQQGDHPANEEFLDACVEVGFRRIWIWSRWKNNWSEWNRLSEEDRRSIGTDQPLSHAVLDFEWASNVDPAQLHDYVNQADRRGIELFFWFPSSYLSNVSPLLKKNPAWIVRTKAGKPYHYAYPDLQAVFQERGYQDYAIERLKSLRREVPFRGIWLDSFQTFGLEVIDYGRPDFPIQFPRMLKFARRLRDEGLSIYVEALTPWLLSSAGMWNDSVTGREYLLTETAPHMGAETLSPESYFRLLAFKSAPVIRLETFLGDDNLYQLGSYANKAYTRVADEMKECVLFGDGKGVLWLDARKRPRVVFAFTRGSFRLPGVEKFQEVLSSRIVQRESGTFKLEPFRVYRILE